VKQRVTKLQFVGSRRRLHNCVPLQSAKVAVECGYVESSRGDQQGAIEHTSDHGGCLRHPLGLSHSVKPGRDHLGERRRQRFAGNVCTLRQSACELFEEQGDTVRPLDQCLELSRVDLGRFGKMLHQLPCLITRQPG